MPNANDGREKPISGDWTRLFPKDHLTAEDLWNGKEYNTPVVVIDRIVLKSLFDPNQNKKVDKPCIFFKGKSKYMLLNVEISKQLEEISGTKDIQRWAGLSVEIWVQLQRNTPQGPMDVPRLRKPTPRSQAANPPKQDAAPAEDPPYRGQSPQFTGQTEDTPF